MLVKKGGDFGRHLKSDQDDHHKSLTRALASHTRYEIFFGVKVWGAVLLPLVVAGSLPPALFPFDISQYRSLGNAWTFRFALRIEFDLIHDCKRWTRMAERQWNCNWRAFCAEQTNHAEVYFHREKRVFKWTTRNASVCAHRASRHPYYNIKYKYCRYNASRWERRGKDLSHDVSKRKRN